MKFPLFAYNSNPKIDRPIVSKSRSYIDALVADGLAVWLPGHKSAQSLPVGSGAKKSKDDSDLASNQDAGTLTLAVIVNNAVGSADIRRRPLLGCEIRAIEKVQNYGRASWADRIVSNLA